MPPHRRAQGLWPGPEGPEVAGRDRPADDELASEVGERHPNVDALLGVEEEAADRNAVAGRRVLGHVSDRRAPAEPLPGPALPEITRCQDEEGAEKGEDVRTQQKRPRE